MLKESGEPVAAPGLLSVSLCVGHRGLAYLNVIAMTTSPSPATLGERRGRSKRSSGKRGKCSGRHGDWQPQAEGGALCWWFSRLLEESTRRSNMALTMRRTGCCKQPLERFPQGVSTPPRLTGDSLEDA